MEKKNKKLKVSLQDLLPVAVDMPVTHPTLGDLDLTIKVKGMFSSSIKQKSIETLAILKEAQKESRPGDLAKLVMDAEKSAAEVAASSVIGWSDDEAMGGPYSPEYAQQLLTREDMVWLREQINKFIADQNNFFRKARP